MWVECRQWTDLRYSLSLLMSWPWAGWASATILTSLLSWASTRTSPFLISSSTIRLKQGTSAHTGPLYRVFNSHQHEQYEYEDYLCELKMVLVQSSVMQILG